MADIQKTKFKTTGGNNLIILPDLSGAINGDVLTYDSGLGAVSWQPPQGGGTTYTAGSMIQIDNDTIDIKNNSCSADGAYSYALGLQCLASNQFAHAEGIQNTAAGNASHAEGIETIASGQAAHSEGYFTRAIGHVSHSDGLFTSAFAQGSYAHGNRTIASANYTFVIGTRNLNNSAAFVVGNGTSGATSVDEDDIRSDAFVVDWNGNVSATGDMYTSAGQVVTDVMLTSATNSTTSFVTNGIADLTSLYTYIKSLEDRIAALEAAQGGDGFTVNGIQPTVNGNTITVGE